MKKVGILCHKVRYGGTVKLFVLHVTDAASCYGEDREQVRKCPQAKHLWLLSVTTANSENWLTLVTGISLAKVNCTLGQATRAQRRRRVIALLFL